MAYKLVDRPEWEAALRVGSYAGSLVDHADGYIHMSTRAQLPQTALKHYAGRGDLVLVTVDLTALEADLRWEPSRGGALFPHLYAPLPVAAVAATRALSVQRDGAPRFEDGVSEWP